MTAWSLLCGALREDWPYWLGVLVLFAAWLYCLLRVRRFRP